MKIVLSFLFIIVTDILFPIFGHGDVKFAFGLITPVVLGIILGLLNRYENKLKERYKKELEKE